MPTAASPRRTSRTPSRRGSATTARSATPAGRPPGGVNDVKLFAATPDGTQMLAVAGQHGKPSNALFSVREIEPNVMIGIATSRNRTIHAGALVKIDARNAADPVCLDKTADQTGHACLDEENAKFEVLTPDVPTDESPSPAG